MKKVRRFLEVVIKTLLVICIAMFIAIIGFFKSKTGIIFLEAALVGFLAVYLMISLLNGMSKKGKYLVANKWRSVSPWLKVVWIGAVFGLDFVLVEQVLQRIVR